MSVLGLDIGTTGSKAIVFNYNGKILASAYSEYDTIFIRDGWFELDPNIIINSALNIIREVSGKIKKVDPIDVMGISCLGAVVIPLDKNNSYLYNGMSFMDTRTIDNIEGIIEMDKFDFYKLTGLHINPYLTLNKILWLRENKFEIYKKVNKFYSFKEILLMKLGIDPKIDHCMASLTMMYDINRRCWSEKIFNNVDVDMNTFPEISNSWGIIGEVKGRYAKELNLKDNVKVILGGADTGACPIGGGAISPGSAFNMIGTFEEVVLGQKKLILTKDMMNSGISCHIHLIPDMYLYVGLPTTGGFVIKWFKNQFCKYEEELAVKQKLDTYNLLLEGIEGIKTDLFFLPHLNGSGSPNIDVNSRGAFLKIHAGATKDEFIKSIIEGLNFEIKLMIDYYEEKICRIDSIYVAGGASKSSSWMQIKANILEKDIISFNVIEAGCLGVAILAGYANGDFKNIDEAIKNMVKVKSVYKINQEDKDYYEKKYNNYKKLYSILKTINS